MAWFITGLKAAERVTQGREGLRPEIFTDWLGVRDGFRNWLVEHVA
jgi:hypothetical protein